MAKFLIPLAISGILCLSYPLEVDGQNPPPSPGHSPSLGGSAGPPQHLGMQEWNAQGWQGRFDYGNGYQDGHANGYGNGNPHGGFGGGAIGRNQQPTFSNHGAIQGRRQNGARGASQGRGNFESRNTYTQQGGFSSSSGGREGRSNRNYPQPVLSNGGRGPMQHEQQSGSEHQRGTFEGGRDFQEGNGFSQQSGSSSSSGGQESRSNRNSPQPVSSNGRRGPIQHGQQSGSEYQRGSFEGGRDFQGGNGFSQQSGFRFGLGLSQGGSGGVSAQQGGVAGASSGSSRIADSNEGGIENQRKPGGRSRIQSGARNEFEQHGKVLGSVAGNQSFHTENGIRPHNRFVGLTGRNATGESNRSEFSGSFGFTN